MQPHSLRFRVLYGVAALIVAAYFLLVTDFAMPNFQADSDGLVMNSVTFSSAYGWGDKGPYGLLLPANQSIPESLRVKPKSEYRDYNSQFGLQGHLFSMIAPPTEPDRQSYYLLLRYSMAALFAALLIGFVLSIKAEFGVITAVVVTVGTLGSPWIAFFGGSVYWCAPLLFAPFIFSWCAYDRYREHGTLTRFYFIVALLVLVKCLCGYEYISVIALSTLPRIFYSGILRGDPISRILRPVATTFVVCVLGFLVAVIVHVQSAKTQLGSYERGFNLVKARMLYRLGNVPDEVLEETGSKTMEEPPLPPASDVIEGYIRKPTFGIIPNAIELLALALAIWVLLRAARKKGRLPAEIGPLKWATGVAAIASGSWFVLARNHTAFHLHLNPLLFFLPFYLLVFILLGVALEGNRQKKAPSASIEEASTCD